MLQSKGDTRLDKARNYKIPPEKEEKCLGVLVSEIRNQYQVPRFRNANFICTAMAYFQRFYLSQSIFIHDPQIMLYACLFLAHKVEGLEDRHNNIEDAFCKILGKDPKTLDLAYHE